MEKVDQEAATVEMILNSLRTNLNKQKPITLYNIYQGVPITYEADVAMIHPDNTIGLIVHPYQAVCIKHEQCTYIESKSLPELVRAYPVSIDYTNLVAVLKGLEFPKDITSDLYHSWVSPETPVNVEISSDERGEQLGKLLEISVLEENEIRIGIAVDEGAPYACGDSLELTFRLSGQSDLIQVQGMIESLATIPSQDQKRMEVTGTAAMGDEISILAFVAKREDQIKASLEKAYKKLRKGIKRAKK